MFPEWNPKSWGYVEWLVIAIAAGVVVLAVAPAFAQQQVITNPVLRSVGTGGNASSTVAVTNTFQQIWAASASTPGQGATRTGCTIVNNSARSMYVTEGLTIAQSSLTNSVILAAGQAYYCSINGVTLYGAINITGTATDAFYAAQY